MGFSRNVENLIHKQLIGYFIFEEMNAKKIEATRQKYPNNNKITSRKTREKSKKIQKNQLIA